MVAAAGEGARAACADDPGCLGRFFFPLSSAARSSARVEHSDCEMATGAGKSADGIMRVCAGKSDGALSQILTRKLEHAFFPCAAVLFLPLIWMLERLF